MLPEDLKLVGQTFINPDQMIELDWHVYLFKLQTRPDNILLSAETFPFRCQMNRLNAG